MGELLVIFLSVLMSQGAIVVIDIFAVHLDVQDTGALQMQYLVSIGKVVGGITDIDVCTTYKWCTIGLVITDKFACIVISTEGVERHRLIPQIRAADSLWDIGIARKFSSYQFGGGSGVLDSYAVIRVNDIISIVVLKWCQGEVALIISSSTVIVITRFSTATVDISMTIRIHSSISACSTIGHYDTIGSFCSTRKQAESPNLGILGRRNIFSQTDVTIVTAFT